MKKYYLIAILFCVAFSPLAASETNKTVIVTNSDTGEYLTIEDGEVVTHTYAYANSGSDQNKPSKKRSKSVSTSTSTSTSNGRSVTSVATSRSGSETEITSVEQLHVFPLFGDKYKRHPDCVLTVIDNQYSKYRELKVNNNAKLVKEIHNLVEQDAAQSPNVMRTYNKDSDQVIMNVAGASIGYTEYVDNGTCSIFISWQ